MIFKRKIKRVEKKPIYKIHYEVYVNLNGKYNGCFDSFKTSKEAEEVKEFLIKQVNKGKLFEWKIKNINDGFSVFINPINVCSIRLSKQNYCY